eukprot:1161075-Pelagomonas_calceolata.AAC.14
MERENLGTMSLKRQLIWNCMANRKALAASDLSYLASNPGAKSSKHVLVECCMPIIKLQSPAAALLVVINGLKCSFAKLISNFYTSLQMLAFLFNSVMPTPIEI